jgi:hypothetical protein
MLARRRQPRLAVTALALVAATMTAIIWSIGVRTVSEARSPSGSVRRCSQLLLRDPDGDAVDDLVDLLQRMEQRDERPRSLVAGGAGS